MLDDANVFDEKNLPQSIRDFYHSASSIFSPSNGYPFITEYVAHRTHHEIYKLKDKTPGVINIHTDKRAGEIVITFIVSGSDLNLGAFVKMTISRYIPVPISVCSNYIEYVDSALRYTYTVTAYSSHQEQAAALLERRLNQEGEQWLNALLAARAGSAIYSGWR